MKGRLLRVSDLNPSQRDDMFALFSKHFDRPRREVFDDDLDEKNWTVLLETEEGELKGFSSLLMYQTQHDGEPLTVVYSGDTIMDPSAWSSSVLSRTWLAAVNHIKREHFPDGKLYWLLISSGFRTYRFLPTFWREFFPRHDAETPEDIQKLMNFLAQGRFGDTYDPETGIVKLPHPQVLREGLRGIPEERRRDAHVSFFDASNPGHEAGDELVCLTEICEENLTRAGRRIWFFKLEAVG